MKEKSGSVSAYVLLCMAVLVTASVGVSALAINSLQRVRVDRRSVTAQQAAFAALDHMSGKAWNSLEPNNGVFVQSEEDISDDLDPLAPGVFAYGWITPTANNRYAWVTASALFDGTTRSVRTLINGRDVGIWNNAVFAGSGASGQAINGNVDIRGSMHILGEGEAYLDLNGSGQRDPAEPFTDNNGNGIWNPGEAFTDVNGDGSYTVAEPYNDTNANGFYDPPLTQTDMNSSFSGNAHVGNHYSGMPAALEALVPPPPTIGGVEQLGAEVRVKHGMIGINGSATIGSSGVIDGGTSKAKIDGSYVNDGFTGNQGASSVFSDNGTSGTYDLGNIPLEMPIISGIGAQSYKAADGSIWSTEENFLDTRALVIPVSLIKSTTAAFSYGPDVYGNSISFTPQVGATPATINITGVVKVAGDLQIGAKDSIRYLGNGTMYASGNLRIDGDLLPRAGFKFPTTARMGLIAKRNMYLATGAGSAQLSLAGAFYAQGTIVSAKQNQIAGTFVANFYDLGTNVPNIYQVPTLTANMPPAMPGDRRFYTLKVKSFRDRSPAPGYSDPWLADVGDISID